MNIEKLIWSKTKTDILKYLLFRRQGISIRALETELEWSFPAIKKQVDSLLEAEIVTIDKDNNKWSIYISVEIYELIKRIFMQSIEFSINKEFMKYDTIVEKYYLGSFFGNPIMNSNQNIDIIVIYKVIWKDFIDKIKTNIAEIFKDNFINDIWMVFMSSEDFQRRYRLSDKFVLSILRNTKNINI